MAKRVFILLVAAGMILAGCSGQQGKESQHKSVATMRIAAILPIDSGYYWEGIKSGLMSGAEGLDVDIKVSCPDTGFDIHQMAGLVKAATAARVDAIVVQGADNAGYIDALKEASEKGILVACVDTDIAGFPRSLYVGTDNYGAGRLMAEKLAAMAGGQANVVALMGGEGFPNLDSRLEGFRDGIAEFDGIRLVDVKRTDFSVLATIEIFRDILEEEPAVDAIVSLDGSGGAAFASAIGPSGPSPVKILCFDMSQDVRMAIRNGIIDGTIVQSQVEMGEKTTQELHRYFIGQQSLPTAVYTDISFVTAAELEDPAYGS